VDDRKNQERILCVLGQLPAVKSIQDFQQKIANASQVIAMAAQNLAG
jgi:hypothetical protein